MKLVQLVGAYDRSITDPDALIERHWTVTGWAQAVSAAGDVRVTVLQRFGRDARLSRNGVDYVFFRDLRSGWPQWSGLSMTLARRLTEAGPDVLHIRGLVAPLEGWAARGILPRATPVLMQDHRGDRVSGGRMGRLDPRRFASRRALRTVDGFLFATAAQADPWRQAELITPQQCVYEVNTTSTDMVAEPRPAARARIGVEGHPAVLWVARLNANKDPLTVLEGFERAVSALPEATLTMVYSEADLVNDVRARVETSEILSRRVRLIGRVPHRDIATYMSAADLFVLGSHREGFSYALVEAIACGAVPVVTDIPPSRRVTGDGSFGTLWRPGDAADLAGALVRTARRDLSALRVRMALHFERTLSWRAVGRAALDIYHDALSRRQAVCR